jgi:hypothetical protein
MNSTTSCQVSSPTMASLLSIVAVFETSLHVSFRVLAALKYQNTINKATLKSPHWLSELQASAPIDGYAMKNGEFTVSLPKDDRIKEDLRVMVKFQQRYQMRHGIWRNPFQRLGFRSSEHPQNSAPFSSSILGAEFPCRPVAFLPRNRTHRAG